MPSPSLQEVHLPLAVRALMPGETVSVNDPSVVYIPGPQGPPGPRGPAGPSGGIGERGPQGFVGDTGAYGIDGRSIFNGPSDPDPLVGIDQDFWLNTTTYHLFGPRNNGAWPKTGQPLIGAVGPRGERGLTGATIRTGSGKPTPDTGNDGDVFYDLTGATVYGVKADGAWPMPGVSLLGPVGPQGERGEQGIQGEIGPSFLKGDGPPADSVGRDLDVYFDRVGRVVYGPKTQGAWPVPGTSLVGPVGPRGQTGNDGADSTVPGPRGAATLNGRGRPRDDDGEINDLYYDLDAVQIFGPKLASGWPLKGIDLIGPQGPRGGVGAQGQDGQDGRPGYDILAGYGPPEATLGKDNDQYFNQQNGAIYGPKFNGAWPDSFVSLIGPEGAGGEAGTKIYAANGPPSELQGRPGDFYFDTSTRILYGPKQETS